MSNDEIVKIRFAIGVIILSACFLRSMWIGLYPHTNGDVLQLFAGIALGVCYWVFQPKAQEE